jgi:uncharacterized protein (DUF302 family)
VLLKVMALKREGFGVLTDIDVAGACNPPLAHKALSVEDKVGVMLPCNLIVQEIDAGEIEVAAIDPRTAMERVGNPALTDLARDGRR